MRLCQRTGVAKRADPKRTPFERSARRVFPGFTVREDLSVFRIGKCRQSRL